MQRGDPQAEDGLPVLGGPVTGMALQSVAGEPVGQPPQQGVALHLGQNAGGGDGEAERVALDDRPLLPPPGAQGKHTVDEQQAGWMPQSRQGTFHRPFGGGADAAAVDLPGTGLTEGPGVRMLMNQRNQGGPTTGRQLLAVGESGGGQRGERRTGEDHGGSEDRPEQAATPDLIDADAVLGELPPPDIRVPGTRWNPHGSGTCQRPLLQTTAEERRRRRRGSAASSASEAGSGPEEPDSVSGTVIS